MSRLLHPMTWRACGIAAVLVAGCLTTPRIAGAQMPPAIEFFVAKTPAVATGDKGAFLVYELTITNLSANPVTLRRVEALDADKGGLYNNQFHYTEGTAAAPAPVGGVVLANLADNELLGDISHTAAARQGGAGAAAGAGGRGADSAGRGAGGGRGAGAGRGADSAGRGAAAGRAAGAGRGAALPPADAGQLGAGSRLYVYLLVNIDGSRPPAHVVHRLTFQRADSTTFLLEGAVIPVERSVIAIGPPFHTGSGGIEWVAVNGPGNISGHRRSRQTYDGSSAIGQRYAIDYLEVDSTGSTRRPGSDRTKNESYYAWGQELLAVADGVIASTKDSIPSNVVGSPVAVVINTLTLGGNFIGLKIADGKYAMYAHVQPGSLRVKVGDKVKRGQVLALLGNAGNSSEPHLHFQISTGPSFMIDSEGLSYTTDFDVIGDCAGIGRPCTRRSTPTKMKGIPLQNEMVRFPK